MRNSTDFSVTILGSNSALPASGRNPSAQLLRCANQHYLIDCGEGTQMQFRRYRLKMQKVKAVFISHLHGDHYFGLLGLMNSMHLLGRTAELTIVAPAKLKSIIDLQLEAGGGRLKYPLNYVATDLLSSEKKEIYRDKHVSVDAFPLKHRIPCTGFVFRQHSKLRSYKAEIGQKEGVPIVQIPAIKHGEDYVRPDGSVVPNHILTEDPPKPKSYAYCTDTLPLTSTVEHVMGVDCLYHEATFMEADKKRAKKTFHSTAQEAAGICQDAKAEKLLIGHFSARYDDLQPLLGEAKSIFVNTELALEGRLVNI